MKVDKHLVFDRERMGGICSKCGKATKDTHVTTALFCAKCCPECHPVAPTERTGEATPISGTQQGLF